MSENKTQQAHLEHLAKLRELNAQQGHTEADVKRVAAEVQARIHAFTTKQTTQPPQPKTYRLCTDTPLKPVAVQQKRNRQRDKVLDLLLNGEHVKRDGSGKLYGVRNVGECVRLLRKDGHRIKNKMSVGTDGTEYHDYYFMTAEDRETLRRVRLLNKPEARAPQGGSCALPARRIDSYGVDTP